MVIEMEKKRNTGMKNGLRKVLHIVQHLLITITVVCMLIVSTGSKVVVQGIDGTETYSIHTIDQERVYEDSVVFNTIMGHRAADIVRLGTIRTQMETKGKYDPKKIIDVTAFNYREQSLPSEYITAKYYLEDLLKWGKYGFEENIKTVSNDFLSDVTKVTVVDIKNNSYQGIQSNYLNTDLSQYTYTNDVPASDFYTDDTQMMDDVAAEKHILVNRYQTVEGKNIEDYVSSWDEYYALCEQIKAAATSLYSNYEEYLKYMDFYDQNQTNIRYCIVKTIGKETSCYSNIPLKTTSEEGVGELFSKYGKYIHYSPADMVYETNSAIEEATFLKMISYYEYAYPESLNLWIAVDTEYPVDDAFIQGRQGFNNYLPYYWELIICAIAAFLLYFILFIYFTYVEGRRIKDKAAMVNLTAFDQKPIEYYLVMVFVLICIVSAGYALAFESGNNAELLQQNIYSGWFKLIAGILVFLLDAWILGLYYSLVRRMKAKTIWKSSLCCKLLQRTRSSVLYLYDHGNELVKSIIPLLIICGINMLLPLLHGALLIIVIPFDILAGYLFFMDVKKRQEVVDGIKRITDGDFHYQIDTTKMHGDNLLLADCVNQIGESIKSAVETSMKDERMKADLITNVSHDIKTPLTSIINYVDLIKRESIEDPKIKNYVTVLDEKSQRLKQLTDDLVEASKISSGNIVLQMEKINLIELLHQTEGEFSEKFEEKGLTIVESNRADDPFVYADSRRIWRVMENLFNNIYKYALSQTRIYIDIVNELDEENKKTITMILKNISNTPLNCNPEELTERFIRGDESRTTEGSGLGLSIAKNLVEIQDGKFEIKLDGDLFKVEIQFSVYDKQDKKVVEIPNEL